MVTVEIYTGLGHERHRVWSGELETVPRVGEEVVLDKDGSYTITVECVTYWIADGKRVEIYGR